MDLVFIMVIVCGAGVVLADLIRTSNKGFVRVLLSGLVLVTVR